ncbi:MAG: radical SAM protein [Pseudomonadales bacterium]|nr:radical SAM protein [Pseudomonadales bacterium]
MTVAPAQFTAEKREAVESFLRFAQGEEFPRWPLEVFLEVSNICDLQCAMCPTFSALNKDRFFALKREDRGVIAYDTATEPLEEVLKHALIIHASGYGEPTIHPQYKELLLYLSRYEALIDFFTNGMHLDDELCQFLVQGHVHRISVSFSGVTAEEYENIYIGGDFERVLGGIRRLAKAKERANSQYPRIEINSLAFRHHIERLPDFVALMAEAGADVIHVKPLRLYGKKIAELQHHASNMHPDREAHIVQQAKVVADAHGVHLASAPYEATEKHAKNYTRAFDAMPDEEREQLFRKILEERIPVADIKDIAVSAAKREQKKAVLQQGLVMRERHQFSVEPSDFFHHQGVPCMEPFKSFHAAFDGRVHTCCFTDAKHWIGHLQADNGETIWHNTIYSTLRQHAVRDEYLTSMCATCMKKGAYPKSHAFQAAYNTYAKWYEHVYGMPFLADLREQVQAVPTSATILQRHRRGVSS